MRVHFIIARLGGETPNPDRATLERAVEALVRTWTDGLAEALTLVHEPIKAQQLIRRYRDAFPVGYREAYVPPVAVADIRLIESLSPIRPLGADFYSRREGDLACAGLKVWSREKPIALSERVPVLENMGFKVVDERTYRIEPDDAGAAEVWLHDMMLERADGAAFDIEALKARLEAALHGGDARPRRERRLQRAGAHRRAAMARRRADPHDLALSCARCASPIRRTTCGRRCGGIPEIAAQIVQLFHTRFDPRLELSNEERGASSRPRSSPRSRRRSAPSKASTRTASCATSSMR